MQLLKFLYIWEIACHACRTGSYFFPAMKQHLFRGLLVVVHRPSICRNMKSQQGCLPSVPYRTDFPLNLWRVWRQNWAEIIRERESARHIGDDTGWILCAYLLLQGQIVRFPISLLLWAWDRQISKSVGPLFLSYLVLFTLSLFVSDLTCLPAWAKWQ